VDLDVDVLDAAFAPACPGARPGGLAPADLLTAARRLGAEPRVAAADLVEVDASADADGRTVMVTAMAALAFAAGVAERTEVVS
jgi:arginase family enzyme